MTGGQQQTTRVATALAAEIAADPMRANRVLFARRGQKAGTE